MTAAGAVSGEAAWYEAGRRMAAGEATLVSLWGDEGRLRLALREEAGTLAFAEVACDRGAFPSVAALHPPASRLERAACDLYGFVALGAPDGRRWLDHGRWPVRHPLGDRAPREGAPDAYAFLEATGPGVHQIPVGPVHAGVIEPGHFRFHAGGEAVVRLEERFGYTHKGVDTLMRGANLQRAASLASRVSGDSTVAYAIAFARAVEAALGAEAPPRAQVLRGLMAELERLAHHFGDIGAICNDAAFALMLAHCGILRERTLRAAKVSFGHRLMMDAVVPGGVAVDFAPAGAEAIRALIAEARATFPKLVRLYDNTASLQDRTVGTGILKSDLARRFGAGGVIGRASSRDFDARRDHPYPPYDALSFKVPTRKAGDVNARIWVRIAEVGESLDLIEAMLARLASGPIVAPLPVLGVPCEGFALVEAFRGDVFAHVRLAGDGAVARCHLRDASWFHWPLLEAAIEENIVADFPLCNKSFNGSYSGWTFKMRNTLLQGLLPPLTEAAPEADDPELASLAAAVKEAAERTLGRSLAIRHVDAGSCNGCELEIHALDNAFYDIERFGFRFVASPRHADVLLVTGPVTLNMREALERTYAATPAPKWVVASGACAADGGVFAGSYAVANGVAAVLPVDLVIPGCPPTPAALMKGLLALMRGGEL